ncbi:MAG: hypothetical protein J2P36_21595, partial [Ktedonobacteraceae bacterium]|nr:hypothetical protein [Ktedonobacteraceae bacterium]
RSLLRKLSRTEIVSFCPCPFLLHHLYWFSNGAELANPTPSQLTSSFQERSRSFQQDVAVFHTKRRLFLDAKGLPLKIQPQRNKEIGDLLGLSDAPFRAVLCGEK